MFGSEYEKEIKKVSLSNNAICRRICHMSANIEDTVINAVKESKIFAMKVDESTDISVKAQLLAFIRYIIDEKVTEQFLCCKELKERTTGEDIFASFTSYLEENGLSWRNA